MANMRVTVGADTKQFQQDMAHLQKSLKVMQQSIASTMDGLGEKISAPFENALKIIRGEMSKTEAALGAVYKGADVAKSHFDMLATSVKKVTASLGSLKTKLMGASAGLDDAGGDMESRGDMIASGISAPFIAIGAAIVASALQTEQGKKAWEKFTNAFAEVQKALAPIGTLLLQMVSQYLPPLVERIKEVADWFMKLSPQTQKMIFTFGALMAGLGPIVMAVGALISGLSGLAGVLGTVMSPVVLIIAAIALLGFALYKLWQNNETFRQQVMLVWGKIKEVFFSVLNAIVPFFQQQWQKLMSFWNQFGPQIMQAISNVWTGIKAVIEFVWPIISAIIQTAWEGIKKIISGALDIIMGLVHLFAALFTGDWAGVWEAVKEIISGAWTVIKGIFQLAFSYIITIIKSGFSAVVNWFNNFKSSASSIVGAIKDSIVGKFEDIKNGIVGAFEGAKSGLKSALNWIISKINGFTSKFNGMGDKLSVIPGVSIPNIPQIPMLATGGNVFGNGQAIVGEAGPELVSKSGSSVKVTPLSAGEKARGISGTTGAQRQIIINLNNPWIREEADVDKLAKAINERADRVARASGILAF